MFMQIYTRVAFSDLTCADYVYRSALTTPHLIQGAWLGSEPVV